MLSKRLRKKLKNEIKLTFVALVLGGITPLYTNTGNNINWIVIVGGIVSTVAFASIGNRILK